MKIFLILLAVSVILVLMDADVRKNKLAKQSEIDEKKLMANQIKAAKNIERKQAAMEGQKYRDSAFERYSSGKINGSVNLNRNY